MPALRRHDVDVFRLGKEISDRVAERRQLEREGYVIAGVGQPVPSVVALTVLGSGLATCALLALLSEEGEVAPAAYWVDGLLGDSQETKPEQPVMTCRCRQRLGLGDCAAPPFMDEV